VFTRVANPVVGAGKPVLHHRIASISPTDLNQQRVLKLVQKKGIAGMP
jgi:hypothetical protein